MTRGRYLKGEEKERQNKRILELYQKEGLKTIIIAKRIGMSNWSVRRRLEEMGALKRMERKERAEKIVEFVRKDLGG